MFNLSTTQILLICGLLATVFGIVIYNWNCYCKSDKNKESKEVDQEVDKDSNPDKEEIPKCEIEELPVFTTFLMQNENVLGSDLNIITKQDKRDMWNLEADEKHQFTIQNINTRDYLNNELKTTPDKYYWNIDEHHEDERFNINDGSKQLKIKDNKLTMCDVNDEYDWNFKKI